jgi:hypothetical protein
MKPAYGLVLLCVVSACDPVVDNAVDQLGDEKPGVKTGPFHRPGQPCLLCHDGDFSIAGTVFERPKGTAPAANAVVVLENADGSKRQVETNAAGNFYLESEHYRPIFPLKVEVQYRGQTATMHTLIGREGSCGACHADPASSRSAGHVYAALDDGGMPP